MNEQAAIAQCLHSLADQEFAGTLEIIVVDNASDDSTAAIARELGARVINEPVRGVCHARQTGTAAARGAIIVSTDADTTFPRDWLASIAATLAQHPDTVATCGPCHFVGGPRWSNAYTRIVFGTTAIIHRLFGRVIYASATNIAFRRNAGISYNTILTQGATSGGFFATCAAADASTLTRGGSPRPPRAGSHAV